MHAQHAAAREAWAAAARAAEKPDARRRRAALGDVSNGRAAAQGQPADKQGHALLQAKPAAREAAAAAFAAYPPPHAHAAPRLDQARAAAAARTAHGAVATIFQDEDELPLAASACEGEGGAPLEPDDVDMGGTGGTAALRRLPAAVFRPEPAAPLLDGPLIPLPRDTLPSAVAAPWGVGPLGQPPAQERARRAAEAEAARAREAAVCGAAVACVGALPAGVPNNVPDYQEPLLEYDDDIFLSLRRNELRTRPNPHYMRQLQRDLNLNMRAILVDWLVEVADEFELRTQTLHITVQFVDRYLSARPVKRNMLQLVGVTSMLVASKYEEVDPPTVDDFVHISDNTYTRADVMRMECDLLDALGWRMTNTTAFDYLRRFTDAANMEKRERYLTRYVVERFLQEPAYLRHRPSVVCAAAVSAALMMNSKAHWTARLQAAAMLEWHEIHDCVLDVCSALDSAYSLRARLRSVYNKYGDDRFVFVSKVCPPQAEEIPRA